MKTPHFYRPTWVEIDLAALASNYRILKKRLSPGTKMMAAVKANAYGHGIVEVSKKLVRCGVDYLGVACVDEALVLRAAGVRAPVLDLGAFMKSDTEAIVKNDITATIIDWESAKCLDACAGRLKKKTRVHIKVDTGMGRLGVWHAQADEFILKVCTLNNLLIEGIYTHFPSADSDETFTRSQIAVFSTLVSRLTIKGIEIPLRHTANSMAVLGFKDSHFNLVRPGLALYGLHPKDEWLGEIDLSPVLAFKTKVVYFKSVSRGRSISYGRTYTAKNDTCIATLPVGYGDGYNRLLSNKARVLIRGRFHPVVGRVCMDQAMVDVGRSAVRVGDEVVLVGRQKEKCIYVEDIAEICGTIPYEVVCWISPRVPRLYINQ
ncbi:MAG TPA: alanine racemase [Candidatus Omnitrophica bacterium]|nr:alanine racemase [Candidatus Omnitrophota bacterium]